MLFDGASKGNPGLVGAGGIIFYPGGNKIEEFSSGIGRKSNNHVKWLALIKGMEITKEWGLQKLAIFGDSMIVISEA